MCVRKFRDFTEGDMGFAQGPIQFGTLTGKTSALLFGSEKFPQLMTVQGYRTTVRGPKTGPSFWTLFCTFFASKSQFFSCRTSSHVSWIVIIRWRLRAPCLQVLSSIYILSVFSMFWTNANSQTNGTHLDIATLSSALEFFLSPGFSSSFDRVSRNMPNQRIVIPELSSDL